MPGVPVAPKKFELQEAVRRHWSAGRGAVVARGGVGGGGGGAYVRWATFFYESVFNARAWRQDHFTADCALTVGWCVDGAAPCRMQHAGLVAVG